VFSNNTVEMAPLSPWLPVRPNQDFDLIVNVVGSTPSTLMKDWTPVGQVLAQRGMSVMMQHGKRTGDLGEPALRMRVSARPFYSMGHGCDILIQLGNDSSESQEFGSPLQPGSIILYQSAGDQRSCPILPTGVIGYAVPLKELCLQGEGLNTTSLVALGVLLHLLGVPEKTLHRWSSLFSAPRSFVAGVNFAHCAIEKRDAYSIPCLEGVSKGGIMLLPEQAILLGYSLSDCACHTTCESDLLQAPVSWAARHIAFAGSMVSMFKSGMYPEVLAYRGPEGKVMTLVRGDECAIASCVKESRSPCVLVAADIPDAIRLLLFGHELILAGHSDRVAVLVEEPIARRQESVDVSTLSNIVRRSYSCALHKGASSSYSIGSITSMGQWEGEPKADVGFVAWGMAQGVVHDAVNLCGNFGLRVRALYPKYIRPFPVGDIESFAKTVDRVVIVYLDQSYDSVHELCSRLPFPVTELRPQPGQRLSPMDIFLREGLGAI
jgi:hypothetical protein